MCATYGAGVTCACIVDVGDQKTSICCVEDGISHKATRYVKMFCFPQNHSSLLS